MWLKSPSNHQLDDEHVDVWRSRIDLPAEKIDAYHASLSAQEQVRAKRFRFPGKFEEYVVTRGLLRHALSLVLSQTVSGVGCPR